MKKLILLLSVVTIITSCSCDCDYKYLIMDNSGVGHYANFYTKTGDGCIMFNNRPGIDNTPGVPTIICGNYTIKKLK